jgi:thiol-disulfide isomerase/thioredoxin
MKKFLLLFIITVCFVVLSNAQSISTSQPTTPNRVQLNQNSVVKDSSGAVYPYIIWNAMMRSGEYSLRSKNVGADSAVFFLVKRTQQQRDAFMANMPKPAESDRFKTGDKFSAFKERDMNGEKLDTKTMAGKVIVLNFWFIGCPPCRAEIPDLNAIASQYKDNKDVLFIAVCLDEAYDIKDFLKTHPFNYRIIDNGRYTANKYGVRLYPTNVIINKEGKIAFSSVSNQPANPYWMKKTIEESLAAK